MWPIPTGCYTVIIQRMVRPCRGAPARVSRGGPEVDMMKSAEPAGGDVDRLRFRILGPVEVMSGDVPARIPPGRQPVILGALLLEPNRVVSIDRLIDVVWGDEPPATARSQVQI